MQAVLQVFIPRERPAMLCMLHSADILWQDGSVAGRWEYALAFAACWTRYPPVTHDCDEERQNRRGRVASDGKGAGERHQPQLG